MFSQKSQSTASLGRTTGGIGMGTQNRRSRASDVTVPAIGMNSRLLGLSEEHHKKDQSIDDTESERNKKLSVTSPSDDAAYSGEVSPGGTLQKSRNSNVPKLSFNYMQPLTSKDKEKMDLLGGLLEQWGSKGLPEMPPLANYALPKLDSGLLEIEDHWTNFIDKTGLTQRQKDQQEALWELLYTEVEYIRALHVIHNLFMCCILNIQNESILNEISLEHMFANINTLAHINSEFWSTQLLPVLDFSRKNNCLFNPSLLKPAFTNFDDRFNPYTKYCVEQKRCSEYVKKCYAQNPLFQYFVMWAEAQKQCNRLKLHDLLVKPMQRLTRYGLLLRAIAKKTDEEDVKENLREMIDNVNQFVTSVDQTLTCTDEKEKLHNLSLRLESYDAVDIPLIDSEFTQILNQQYMKFDIMAPMPGCGCQLRYLLLEGPLRLRDMNNKIDIHCILFTDMLVFAKQSKRDKLRIIKPPVRIDYLSIHEMKESTSLLLVHLTDFGVAQAVYTLSGENISKWMKTFKKAQTMYMKFKEQAKKEQQREEQQTTVSLADDETGFSGPLQRKDSEPLLSEFSALEVVPDAEAPGFDSLQIERSSSFSSLNGNSRMTADEQLEAEPNVRRSSISQSVSSPDIGRKHHTLPPNYKHQIGIQRNSSSSSGENTESPRKRRGDKKRNKYASGSRYLTADGITELKKSSSADADSLVGSEDKVSWEVGDKEADDDSDNDFPAGSESCDSSSVTNVSLPADSKKGDGSEFYTVGAEIGHIRKSKSGRNSGKRNREYMKNLHEFLQASSPGVEI